MRAKSLLLIAVFAVILQSIAYSQNDKYQFSHLDINNGLSSNQINCIFKDSKGFMWFGTTSGLNRYDGYKFRVFKNESKDTSSISDNYVSRIYEGPGKKMWVYTHNNYSIYDPATEKFYNNINPELARLQILTNDLGFIKKDSRGNYWFSTSEKGLYCYHEASNTTTYYSQSFASKPTLHSNWVMDMVDCGNGNVWLIYSDGVFEKLDVAHHKIVDRAALPASICQNKAPVNFSIQLDNDRKLWIWAAAKSVGVYSYNTGSKTLKHYSKETPGSLLNSNIINSVIIGDDHKIWIGTDHGGINVIDPKTDKVTYLLPHEDDPKSLMGDNVVLYKDQDGIIWAGTYKQGISYYHKGIFQFPVIRRFPSDKASLPAEDVDCFEEDHKGNLWVGTNGGGLIYYDQNKHQFTNYKHNPNNINSLTGDVVVSLCIDHEGKLWIGTYFGGLDCFDGKTFTHYRADDKNAGAILDDRIYTIFEDKVYNIWVGTFAGGVNIFNRKTQTFSAPYNKALNSRYIGVLYPDKKGNVWVGEDKGLDFINTQTHKVTHYIHNAHNANSLVARDVNCLIEDRRQLVWIGTKGGLSILNPVTNQFTNLDGEKGLPANNIVNILEDKQGRIWCSTTRGVTCITLTGAANNYKFDIKNFDESDGLQGREFNVNAAFKTREGKLIFGGAHGFNLFDPAQIGISSHKPPLVFTDLQLFNKSVVVGDTIKGSVVLEKSISDTKAIVFNHSQNVFSLEFAACDFFNPNKVQYQYQLEGFDKTWLSTSANTRRATYTNLDAGDYIFKVKAFNSNNVKNASYINLKITVLPPFWKSPLAYLLYFLGFVASLFYIRHRGILKLKTEFAAQQHQLEIERKAAHEVLEARRMHELDLMKIKFFTNVSHEFRTPLSLILSPIEQLIKINEKPEQQQQLQMIKRNGRRLLNLVNQLLDFRKMEFKELKLSLTRGDIVAFVKEISCSFTDIAQQKNLRYVFDSEIETLITEFDHDKLERILFNLLSNAFKFTPSGGHICILLSLNKNESTEKQQMLEIKVIDTGIGITTDKQDKIFERFFQDDMPQNLLNQGSGIGLSITREFVKMHGGEISVESEPNHGSCFTILLPVVAESNLLAEPTVIGTEPEAKRIKEDILRSNKKPVVLLIEDNDDMRFYLKDNLKHQFTIIEACNGKEGWQKTLAIHPNLVVSDISMPEMNGIELSKKIKADSRTTHIPIILLTALNEPEDQLLGLESGANDYITKPFNFEILLSKIKNLLLLQETLKKTYQKQQDVKVEQIEVASEDDKFIKNAVKIVEANITNANFSVEELSRLMLLSRVSLYKKLLTLTGKTPVDFIRNIRLEKAVQLLEKSKLNIANVAYEVGFANPTYFAKVFREEYGMLPSEYILQLKKKEILDTV
ncbi:hybrid sensor histidine kinase/response regulator transcription factor [Mucilaginibacter jinjuensis]|uniref:histidine kinase n=1 Tax=Mucilaginibacter jinjuensis TaxID=1176721 RepID=A0ABY7T3P8_9SPHI|nr:hybrid sensor histidine kinase/response regulator transcription factor [Mucilaginibacter jinjuensis]WCT11069.1 two-component regulator propeller domain-containing protein [Mucilaginibacter jinjuensis]